MNISNIVNYIKQRAAKSAPLNNSLKIDFGREFIFIDGYNRNKVSLENKAADCTIQITKDNFIALINNRLSATFAFLTGKIKVKGDRRVVNKLKKLLK